MDKIVLAMLLPAMTWASNVELSGKVHDEAGRPLFGAEVSLTASPIATYTRPDGTWILKGSIPVPEPGPEQFDTLVYSWHGSVVARVPAPTHVQSGIGQVILTGTTAPPSRAGRTVEIRVPCIDRSDSVGQQGLYARQSVSHLQNLILRGNARGLDPARVEMVGTALRKGLRLPRFDDNPVPPAIAFELEERLRESDSPSDEEIQQAVDEALVPAILDVLRLRGMSRAADLRTEYQKHSMFSDKTRSMDITGAQLLSVMDAAWIYIPVVDDVVTNVQNGVVTTHATMTIQWYHVTCDSVDGLTHARLEHSVTSTGSMAAKVGAGFDAEQLTYQSAVKSCVRGLLTKTKEIPAFGLSGQVTETGKFAVALDVGAREGVRLNDQYLLIENVVDSSGSSEPTEVGWVKIYSKGGSDSISRSGARIVSGIPYPGLSVKEAPVSSISWEIGYLSEPVVLTSQEVTQTYYGYSIYPSTSYGPKSSEEASLKGVQLGAHYSLPWWYGISIGLGTNLLFGEQMAWDLKLSTRQSVPVYRRLSVYIEPEVAVRLLPGADSRNPTDSVTGAMPPAVLKSGLILGAEIALTPNLNLRIQTGSGDIDGLDYTRSDRRYSMSSDGRSIGFSLQWSPRSVAVDPLDLLAGQAWAAGGAGQGSPGAFAPVDGPAPARTPYDQTYVDQQRRNVGSASGSTYQSKKAMLESRRTTLESQLSRARRRASGSNAPQSASWEVSRLEGDLQRIDMQILDLEQMRSRDEIP